MSALETLREAAALMRERAEAATPGPWEAENMPNGRGPLVVGANMAVAETFDKPHLSDAEHIASWDPAVALAVADWLDREAEIWDAILVQAVQYAPKVEVTIGLSTHEQALAVATAYLAEPPP